jgi:hypothetical protein
MSNRELLAELNAEAKRRGAAYYGARTGGAAAFAESYYLAALNEELSLPAHVADADVKAYYEGTKQGRVRRRHWKSRFAKDKKREDAAWVKSEEKRVLKLYGGRVVR